MKEMSTNEVINLLLCKETEVSNKFYQAISEILRLDYGTNKGNGKNPHLIDSVQYSLEEIERIVSRKMIF